MIFHLIKIGQGRNITETFKGLINFVKNESKLAFDFYLEIYLSH